MNRISFALLTVAGLVIPAHAEVEVLHVADLPIPLGDGSSWEEPLNLLDAALKIARAPGSKVVEIRVAQGVYEPTLDDRPLIERSFHPVAGVVVKGGYAGPGSENPDERDIDRFVTIIGRKGVFPRYHMIRASGEDESGVFDGFTVRDGLAIGSCCDDDRGGGLFAEYSSPTFIDCVFTENQASNTGAGAWLEESNATFIRCTFADNDVTIGNSGGALQVVFSSSALAVDCVFSENSVAGVAGQGGAVFVGGDIPSDMSSFTAIGCRFEGHLARWGGAIDNDGDGFIWNCVFLNNEVAASSFPLDQAGRGGAIQSAGDLVVANSTFVGNQAQLTGGAIEVFEGFASITNCIFDGNLAGDAADEFTQIGVFDGVVDVNYSLVDQWSGSLGGFGNFDADPMFVDPENSDYRLAAGSPAIDAGANAALPPDVLDLNEDGDLDELLPIDLDGLPRFVDAEGACDGAPIVDLGAYEFQAGPSSPQYFADLSSDGVVDAADVRLLLDNWGRCSPGACCSGDLDVDGEVGPYDLALLLAAWDR